MRYMFIDHLTYTNQLIHFRFHYFLSIEYLQENGISINTIYYFLSNTKYYFFFIKIKIKVNLKNETKKM